MSWMSPGSGTVLSATMRSRKCCAAGMASSSSMSASCSQTHSVLLHVSAGNMVCPRATSCVTKVVCKPSLCLCARSFTVNSHT
jgi:hypothetical protein